MRAEQPDPDPLHQQGAATTGRRGGAGPLIHDDRLEGRPAVLVGRPPHAARGAAQRVGHRHERAVQPPAGLGQQPVGGGRDRAGLQAAGHVPVVAAHHDAGAVRQPRRDRPTLGQGQQQHHGAGRHAGGHQLVEAPLDRRAAHRRVVDDEAAAGPHSAGVQRLRAVEALAGAQGHEPDAGVAGAPQLGDRQRAQVRARRAHAGDQDRFVDAARAGPEPGDQLGDVGGVLVEAAEAGRQAEAGGIDGARPGRRLQLAPDACGEHVAPRLVDSRSGRGLGQVAHQRQQRIASHQQLARRRPGASRDPPDRGRGADRRRQGGAPRGSGGEVLGDAVEQAVAGVEVVLDHLGAPGGQQEGVEPAAGSGRRRGAGTSRRERDEQVLQLEDPGAGGRAHGRSSTYTWASGDR